MPSSFSWLDYSEHDRQVMMDVVDLFNERTTRDELGIGSIRDMFADYLFPGTSTIQTAAKYFLIVPWVFLSLEDKKIPSEKAAESSRNLEIRVAKELVASGDTQRVIGRRAKENLQRLPSLVYWQGLQEWGIREFMGFPQAYFRDLDELYQRRKSSSHLSADYDDDSSEIPLDNWHSGLPSIPEDFPVGLQLALSYEEADYLRTQILTHCGHSLLAHILKRPVPVEDANFAWELPLSLPANLKRWLDHGRNFSEVMHGAQLLYNLYLAQMRQWSEKIEHYEAAYALWCDKVSLRQEVLRTWDTADFWFLEHSEKDIESTFSHNIGQATKSFVQSWIETVRNTNTLTSLANDAHVRTFITDRECAIKGKQARLLGDRPLELWNGEAGAGQLDLRWRSARRSLNDILTGLEANNLAATA